KKELEKEFRVHGLDMEKLVDDGTISKLFKVFNVGKEEDLFIQVGYGELSSSQVMRKVKELRGEAEPESFVDLVKPKTGKSKKKGKSAISVMGLDGVMVRYSKCCSPIPGDDITGIVTKGRGVSIHRKNCVNVTGVTKGRVVQVAWNTEAEVKFPVSLEVEAFDRVGLIRDVLDKISETNTNIAAATIRTKRGSSAILKLTLDVNSSDHLKQVVQAIQKVSDVFHVYRVMR
ncbi:MAG: ACT domain-containing protein, partial [bacterium]